MAIDYSQEVKWESISSLKPHPENPRFGDIGAIAESIKRNGWFGSVVAQVSTRYILAGNHRVMAAQSLGMSKVPVFWVDCDEIRAKAILIAENRTNQLASWDEDGLSKILEELANAGELQATGFDGDDVDAILASVDDRPDEPVEPEFCPTCKTVLPEKFQKKRKKKSVNPY